MDRAKPLQLKGKRHCISHPHSRDQELRPANALTNVSLNQCVNTALADWHIVGGVHIRRGAKITLSKLSFFRGPDKGPIIRIDGGANGVTLDRLMVQWRSFRLFHVILGGWTDYDVIHRPPVRNVKASRLYLNKGETTRVLVVHAEKPVIDKSGDVQVLVVPRWMVRSYFAVRRFLARRRVMKQHTLDELKVQSWEENI
jgi:hypothetical protein